MVCLNEPTASLPASRPTSDSENGSPTEVTSQRLSTLTLTHAFSDHQSTLDQMCVKKKRPSTATLNTSTSGCCSSSVSSPSSASSSSSPTSIGCSAYSNANGSSVGHHLRHKRAKVMSSNHLHNTPLFNKNTGLPLCSSPVSNLGLLDGFCSRPKRFRV
jgi:hypothetical protein